MTKQLVWIGTAVMTTLLALVLVWEFRLALVYVFISLAVVATLRPLVKRPTGQSWLMRGGVILLLIAAVAGLGSLLVVGLGAAINDIEQLGQQLSRQDRWHQPAWLLGSSFQELLDTRLPTPSQLFSAVLGDEGEFVLPAVLGFTQSIFSLISGFLVILFLSVYWGADQSHFERLWLSLLPAEQRARARDMWRSVEQGLGAYIRSEFAQACLAGVLLGMGYWLIGSPYAALLALLGVLALLLPFVGVILAVLLPLLLGLLTSVPLSLLTVLYTLCVIVILRRWVAPHLSEHRQYNAILTLVFLMALADAYGLVGLIVAPPLAAVCQILWDEWVNGRTVVAGAGLAVADLKARQAQVAAMLASMEEPPLPVISSSMNKLTTLLEQAESAVP